jgi:hypothetical protein
MAELLLERDTCEREGCLVSLRYGQQPMVIVFVGDAGPRLGRMAESVHVYCSHRCEALDRPEESDG